MLAFPQNQRVGQRYAANWTIKQLREPAQKIGDRIEALMREPLVP